MSDSTKGSWKHITVIGLASLVALAAGCSRSRMPERKPVVPVRGMILVGGKPAAGAVVCFHPAGDSGLRSLRSNSRVAADGTFALTTYVTSDGAPPGQYVVTVFWGDPSQKHQNEDEETDLPPDRLGGRFAARESSKLRAAVGDKPLEFAPLDLGSSEVTQSSEYQLREK